MADGREHLSLYSAMYFNSRIPGNRLADDSTAAAGDAAQPRLGGDGVQP